MNADTFSPLWQNWRSGMMVAGLFFLVWSALFITAFMIAFGNETMATHAVLHAIGIVLNIADPLLGYPDCLHYWFIPKAVNSASVCLAHPAKLNHILRLTVNCR